MEPKAHFGNPLIEQRSLYKGEAICVLEPHGVIEVTGVDRLSWLHSLLSQDIKNLSAGQSAEALLLDPNGHIEQLIFLIEDGSSCFLIVESSKTLSLLEWLNKMVFRMKVEVKDRSLDFAVVGATKVIPDLASSESGKPLVFEDSWPGVSSGGHRYSTRKTDFSWFLHLVLVHELDSKLSGKSLAGFSAADALRVSAGRPSIAEVDEKTLPHELDLLSTAVHLSKGCYRGQETVAKVHNLGHPPRRLTFLHLDGSGHSLPAPGDQVRVLGEEKVRGKITSVAQHFEMGPIALALLQRAVPEDAVLEVLAKEGLVSATQEIIVPQSAGSVANVPRLPRLNLGASSKLPRS